MELFLTSSVSSTTTSSTTLVSTAPLMPSLLPPSESSMEALGDLLQVECYVDERIVRENRRTMQVAQQSFLEIEEAIKRLSAENDALEQEVIASESRKRQMELTHQAAMEALHAEMAQTQQACDKLNAESVEISRQTTEQIQTIARAEAEGIRTIDASAQAQMAAMQQEAAAAQVAALTQQQEKYRQELTPVSSALDTMHRNLTAKIQECEPHTIAYANIETLISSSEVVALGNSITDQILQYAPEKGKLDQSRKLEQRLQPITDQLKTLMHDFSQPAVTMHV